MHSLRGSPGAWHLRHTRWLWLASALHRIEPEKPGPCGLTFRPPRATLVVAWQARQLSSV